MYPVQYPQSKEPKRLLRVLLAGAVLGVALVLASFADPVFLDSFSAVHHPHSDFSAVPERTNDDGRGRVSLFSTARSRSAGCCANLSI